MVFEYQEKSDELASKVLAYLESRWPQSKSRYKHNYYSTDYVTITGKKPFPTFVISKKGNKWEVKPEFCQPFFSSPDISNNEVVADHWQDAIDTIMQRLFDAHERELKVRHEKFMTMHDQIILLKPEKPPYGY